MAGNLMGYERCVECYRRKTYEVPDDFCDYHWHLWWYTGNFDGVDDKEFESWKPTREERFFYKVVKSGKRIKSKRADKVCYCS